VLCGTLAGIRERSRPGAQGVRSRKMDSFKRERLTVCNLSGGFVLGEHLVLSTPARAHLREESLSQ